MCHTRATRTPLVLVLGLAANVLLHLALDDGAVDHAQNHGEPEDVQQLQSNHQPNEHDATTKWVREMRER